MPLLALASIKSVQVQRENRNCRESLLILLPHFPLFVTLCSNISSNIRYQANVSSSSKVKIKFTGYLLRARYKLNAQFEMYNLFLTTRKALFLSYFTEGETEAQKGWLNSQGHTPSKWQKLDANPDLSNSKTVFFIIISNINFTQNFNKFIYFIYIYFWLRWVFVAARKPSLVVASRGYSLLRHVGLSLWWLLVVEHGLQARGLQQLWLAGSKAQAQQLWCTGLVALWHVGSSQTRA